MHCLSIISSPSIATQCLQAGFHLDYEQRSDIASGHSFMAPETIVNDLRSSVCDPIGRTGCTWQACVG